MQDNLRAMAIGLVATFVFSACEVGGVTVNPINKDAGPSGPEVGKDLGPDIPVFVFNLDALGPADVAPAATCGNGQLEALEECDDGNTTSGEGCTSECRIETDWACPTPGAPCKSTVVCGDGRISGNETCDDRNTTDGDGCSANCGKVEDGWACPAPGIRCQPKCGDGVLTGWEQCDDGKTEANDGCSAGCKVETGFACPKAGEPCHATVCGDDKKEGAESCDDGNTVPGDGCTMECKVEPTCVGSEGCTSPCGDGLKLPEEGCDDGNRSSGDGCSSDCKLEANWTCKDVVDTTTSVPVIFRDMIPQNATLTDPPVHPNFEVPRESGRVVKNIVKDALGADRLPEYNPDVDITLSRTTNAEDFNSWYRSSKYSKSVIDKLPLVEQADGTFLYDHSGVYSGGQWTTPAFFPLDDKGWATPANGADAAGPEVDFLQTCDLDKAKHNFSFTSEVRYWFEYQGGEALSFIGDDDVWVFVNGKLAVDLGGVHLAASGSVTLDATTAATFNLTVGKIYEIVIFQAERRVSRSSYKLTLGKFNRTYTDCTPKCGDGVINGAETCDEGPNNSDTAYGGCTTQCVIGPYCGDAKVDTTYGEECDDGVNLSPYGKTTGCSPGCRKSPFCGDNKVDSLYGEQCDNGANNGTSLCDAECKAIVP
jgi:fibro-slime domain-containing protein